MHGLLLAALYHKEGLWLPGLCESCFTQEYSSEGGSGKQEFQPLLRSVYSSSLRRFQGHCIRSKSDMVIVVRAGGAGGTGDPWGPVSQELWATWRCFPAPRGHFCTEWPWPGLRTAPGSTGTIKKQPRALCSKGLLVPANWKVTFPSLPSCTAFSVRTPQH